jgi:hypothetical protein
VTAIETTGTELTPAMLDLFEHEKVIEQGLAGFVEVGLALLAIRDGKKYRHAGYATFEDYCQRRWNMTRKRGYDLMAAAETVAELSPMGDIPQPQSERQVRPLRAVDPAERAEVWAEAVEAADGGQPTAKQVEAAIAARRVDDNADTGATGATGEVGGWQFDDPVDLVDEQDFEPAPRRTPVAVPKPVIADGVPPHPATYPNAVMAIFRELIPAGSRVLDPFAGVGTIHELRPECATSGIEIESEWAAASEHTLCGDSRVVMAGIPADAFDVIATSPAYGNRLADAYYAASDAHARRTYALDLGRPLSDGSGAGVEFDTDGAYEELHEAVWAQAARVLRSGGLLLLNCKDFQRDGRIMPVTGWHVATLTDLGFVAINLRTLPAAGLPFTSAKPLSELVVAFRKGSAA